MMKPREIISDGEGNLSDAMAEVQNALLSGACCLTITIDRDWCGSTLLLTRPAGSPPVDEMRALELAHLTLTNELKGRRS